ncbi:MAG: tRNA lysidine(34) synthetase TilS [Burkholderiales bacterium]|nr:tRNA lysidine(34) synthetase TilS [Burkholderiales bacterium]
MTEKTAVAFIFERALKDIFTRVCHLRGEAVNRIAIAYSGGLDSSVLLHLASHYAQAQNIQIWAFHVHHGISPNADAWFTHCEREAQNLGFTFDARRIQLMNVESSGIEEAARLQRYAALGELCRKNDVPLFLTAHHQDDQAETVLLQLLRGSGVAGLSGMEVMNSAPELLGDESLIMARPLLDVSRAELKRYAEVHGIAYVDDESNADPRYARNALRHRVMPALEENFPGFRQRFARSSHHMQSAQRLLNTLAEQDLASLVEGNCLLIERLANLSCDRIDNLLRFWLSRQGMRMPSASWLSELSKQLLEAKDDAQLCVAHPDGQVRRYRGRVYVTRMPENASSETGAHRFYWRGEVQLTFAEFRGRLHFDEAMEGVSDEWLRLQSLQICYRQGGERLKPAFNRSTRSLKHHYQSLNVPPWLRDRLPLVLANDRLLYAAGIGMDCHHFSAAPGTKIALRWESFGAV